MKFHRSDPICEARTISRVFFLFSPDCNWVDRRQMTETCIITAECQLGVGRVVYRHRNNSCVALYCALSRGYSIVDRFALHSRPIRIFCVKNAEKCYLKQWYERSSNLTASDDLTASPVQFFINIFPGRGMIFQLEFLAFFEPVEHLEVKRWNFGSSRVVHISDRSDGSVEINTHPHPLSINNRRFINASSCSVNI